MLFGLGGETEARPPGVEDWAGGRSAWAARRSWRTTPRAQGRGKPHRASTLRLFGLDGFEPRDDPLQRLVGVVPYLEGLAPARGESVPYKVGLVPMRSYGEKPRSFLEKVPAGLLPASSSPERVYTSR